MQASYVRSPRRVHTSIMDINAEPRARETGLKSANTVSSFFIDSTTISECLYAVVSRKATLMVNEVIVLFTHGSCG
ncbi:hypothetical protein TNCV_989931 [Trichonephila clavipes]|nr:hypothetical protein TNCV_989931 [Trichonephila clavipes]